MEALPCELILIDTSKNPVVHEILLEYTHQVYEFEWVKDFAKARNEGLKRAKGEWFLFLDDDEWFVDVEDLISFFQSGEYKNYGYACHRIRNFFDTNYMTYSDGWVSRLIRIDEDTAFVGRVHESFQPIRGQRKDLEILSYHSGYIYETEEKQRAHFARNTSLLLEALQEEPDNMRWHMQLMQEYGSVQEWEDLIACSQKAIEILGDVKGAFEQQQRGAFVAGQIWAFFRKGAYEECIESGKRYLKDTNLPDVAKALVCLRVAEAFLALDERKLAVAYASKYLEAAQQLSNNGETFVRKNSVPYLGEAFENARIQNAYAIILIIKLRNRDYAQLEQCYEKLGWKQAKAYSYGHLERDILQAIADSEYIPMFSEMISDAYRNRGLCRTMHHAFDELDMEETLEDVCKRRIMYAYAKADGNAADFWYARVFLADEENREDDLVDAILAFYENAENVFVVPKGLKEIASRRGLEIEQCWNSVGPDKWTSCLEWYLPIAESSEVDKMLETAKIILGEEHWKCQDMMMRILHHKKVLPDWIEKKYEFYEKYYQVEMPEEEALKVAYINAKKFEQQIEAGIAETPDENLEQMMHDFMIGELEFGLLYLKDEAFQGDMEMLSPAMRAAVWLNEYFGRADATTEAKIAFLRESVKCYSKLSDPIKRLANYLVNRQNSANTELLKMASAMKEKIREMVDQGLREEALQVLMQVRTMLPEDQELIALEKMIKK